MALYRSTRKLWIRSFDIVMMTAKRASPGIFACVFVLLSWSIAGASPEMGSVYVVKSDPSSPATFFAGAERGVFTSTDAGATWAATGLTQAAHALAIAPGSPTTLYAGTDSGLFKSVNGGTSWSAAGVTGAVCSIEVDPEIATTLYVSTCSRIMKSIDGGANWTGVGPPDGSISRVAIAVGHPTMLYAASATDAVRVYNSVDGGVTWSNASVEHDVGSGWLYIAFDLSIDPVMPTTVYVNYWGWGDCDQDTCAVVTGTIKKSMDGGTSWFPVDQLTYCCTPLFWDYGGPTSTRQVTVSAVAIDPLASSGPLGSSTLYAAWRMWWSCMPWDTSCVPGSGAWISKSTDGGMTWSSISDLGASALWFDPLTRTVLYAATDSGLMQSTDGGMTWNGSGAPPPPPPPPPPPAETTPPDTSITSARDGSGTVLANDGVTLSASLTLSFTGTDNVGLSRFECQLDGAGFNDCTSPLAYNALALGRHTFEVRAVDTSNNVDATPAGYTWTIDATPETTITGAVDGRGKSLANGGRTTSGKVTFRFAGTDNGTVVRFECRLDSVAFTSCTSPVTYEAVSRGTHTFRVRAVDNNGFADPSPAVFSWTR